MDYNEIYEEASKAWLANGAKGTIALCDKVPVINLLKQVLEKMLNKNPSATILIVLPSLEERLQVSILLKAIKKYELLASKQIIALTHDYVRRMVGVKQTDLLVLLHPDKMNLSDTMKVCKDKYKFILGLTEDQNADLGMTLFTFAPYVYKCNELDLIAKGLVNKICEYHIESVLTKEEQLDFDRYDQSVKDCVSICGTLDNIKAVRSGDLHTNRSPMQVAYDIALENGWSPNMDMSVQFNVDIDKFYNPHAIMETGEKFFNHTRERNKLVATGLNKIVWVQHILLANPDKKFLIVSDNWSFAENIVNNVSSGSDLKGKVYPFYNQQKSVYGVDEHGNKIVYKSGAKKGQPKVLGVKAQHDYAMELLSNGKIQALSATSTLPAYTNIEIDCIVYTSPFCEDVSVLRNRTTNFKFVSEPIVIYKLYNKGTKEHVTINEVLPSIGKMIVKHEEIDNLDAKYIGKLFAE